MTSPARDPDLFDRLLPTLTRDSASEESDSELQLEARNGVRPREYPPLPCGHLDLESAVTAQNDDFEGSFRGSSSRSLNVKFYPSNSILSLDTY